MKTLLPLSLLGLVALSACGAPARADNFVIEAEANPTAGDMKIIEDDTASGGKAVSIARDWQPLFKADVPAGEAFTIWVRYKGGAILAKKTPDGKQSDLKWSYKKPAQLEWVKLGRYTREELGEQLLIIRGGGGGQGPILDAVAFATDEDYDPQKDAAPAAETTGAKATDEAAKTANLNEGAAVALGLQDAPKGAFFEAEKYSKADIVEAQGASGGQAVQSTRPYQPLVSIPLPAGDAWKVWVRHKGGPFAVKTKVDGKNKDAWTFFKPKTFGWRELDVFSREELGGTNLIIGRGAGDGDDNVEIDAVVLQNAVKKPLPADQPDANLAAQNVSASVDWNAKIGTISALAWGINENEIRDPKKAGDAEFQTKLAALKTPLVRIHQAGLMDAWTNAKTRDWDVEKIKAAFAASTGYGDAPIMLNLTWAPRWLSQNKVLNQAQEDELAALWGRLVGVMRDDVKRPVAYWEITNELDISYEKAGKLDDLWRLYNKCAAAMRKADPKAKLGGPALTWAKPAWIAGFLRNCDDVQFVSWHNYGTGDLYETNESLFKKVDSNIGGNARTALKLVKENAKGRELETFLTETNVKYTWDPFERRHQNAVGSVFHALVVKEMAEAGVTGVTLWQERGQAYGSLVDNKNQVFPSYYLYGWGPQYLSGERVKATSGDESLLEILPVTGKNGKAVLLINKAPRTLKVPAASELLPGVKGAERVDSSGYAAKVELKAGELELPGFSLTLLRGD